MGLNLKSIGINVKLWFSNGFRIQPIGINEKTCALNMKSIGINEKAMVDCGFRIETIGINAKAMVS